MQINKLYNFKNIYIEKKFKRHKNTKRILDKLNIDNIIYTDDVNALIKKLLSQNKTSRDENLFLGGIKGDILQKCPGSHGHICCNYYVINLYAGCPLNCQYCILQSYLNQPFTIINVDLENIFKNLKNIFNNNKSSSYRIGTGELSDSLVYDPITSYSIDFIDFFSEYKNVIFEFKTKTDFIDNIIKFDSCGNIVVGFSVNPQSVIDKIEGYAIGIKQRFQAIKKLINKNYNISLHFDPIINIDNFDEEYDRVIKLIKENIPEKNLSWISLGTMRFNTNLKNSIIHNFPDNKILSDEFIECYDNKYRYFKPIRLKLYKNIMEKLKKIYNNPPVYLCMESPDIWQKSLNYQPQNENIKILFK